MRELQVINCGSELGESPVWDPRISCLWWTDILSQRLHRWQASTHRLDTFDAPERVGSFGLTADPAALICAFASGFGLFEPGSGKATMLAQTIPGAGGCRMNDGRVARDGRFWAGSMVEDDRTPPGCGQLFRYNGGGEYATHLEGIDISNGICWSPDGAYMYFTDSPSGMIRRGTITAGQVSGWADFARGLDGAHPDGAAVDAEGYLWSAQWGRGTVVRYSPHGEIDRLLEVPCPQPTCVAFGGADYRTLFVTTARVGLSERQLEEYPDSGAVFVYETDIQGLPEPICTVL